jgi:hypothetical protein
MSENSSGVTLTQINNFFRSMIKYGIFFIIGFLLLRAGYFAFVESLRSFLPTPIIKPTAGFGLLPNPKFETKKAFEKPNSYALSLPVVRGKTKFPEFGEGGLIEIYSYAKKSLSLTVEDRVRGLVKLYGFTDDPKVLNETTYRFEREKNGLKLNLKINALDNHMSLTSKYTIKENFVSGNDLPDKFSTMQTVQKYLQVGNLLPEEFTSESFKISYVKALSTNLQEVKNIHEANFLKVNLERPLINDKYGFVYSNPKKLSIEVIVGAYENKKMEIVAMEYQYTDIDLENFHTYPLRSVESAWLILQSGEGYIAEKAKDPEAIIENIDLAYYETYDDQEYLQPVYVFSNRNGFLGYVTAVDPKFLEPKN